MIRSILLTGTVGSDASTMSGNAVVGDATSILGAAVVVVVVGAGVVVAGGNVSRNGWVVVTATTAGVSDVSGDLTEV